MSDYIEVKDANGLAVKLKGFISDGLFTPRNAVCPNGTIDGYISKFAANEVGGDTDANKDFGTTPAVYSIAPPAGEVWYIAKIVTYIEDGGTFDSGGYGNGTALANGITLKVMRGTVEQVDLTDDQPIKTNTHWKKMCGNVVHSNWGSGNESISSRWEFAEDGIYIKLDGDESDSIQLGVSDDMTDLVSQTFLFQGFKEC